MGKVVLVVQVSISYLEWYPWDCALIPEDVESCIVDPRVKPEDDVIVEGDIIAEDDIIVDDDVMVEDDNVV